MPAGRSGRRWRSHDHDHGWCAKIAKVICVGAAVLARPALATASGPELFTDSTTVHELTPRSFEDKVAFGKTAWFVDFYAHWCPHCIRFAPVWEQLASKFRGDQRVRFGAVDCANSNYASFCMGKKIGAYPTLRAFNLPGASESHTVEGVHVHTGELHPDEEADLIVLLRNKLEAIGPGPVNVGVEVQESPPGAKPSRGHRAQQPPRPEEPAATPYSAAQRLVDAELALAYSLRQGVLLAAAQGLLLETDTSAVSGKALRELLLWLDFLSAAMPTPRARSSLRELASVARSARDGSGKLAYADWIDALDSQAIDIVPPGAGKDPSGYWQLCTTYTCGLWTLFHLVLANSAAKGDAVASSTDAGDEDTKGPTSLKRIRGFVANFFGCHDCARHFLEMYDSCQFGRCDLKRGDAVGASLWLWQAHNNVTLRVASEWGTSGQGAWPPPTLCKDCWQEHGNSSWSAEGVYGYIVRAYVPEEGVEGLLAEMKAAWKEPSVSFISPNLRTLATAVAAISALALLCSTCRTRRGQGLFEVVQPFPGVKHELLHDDYLKARAGSASSAG